MSAKIRPINDQVLIRPAKGEGKTPGGILLPEVARQKTFRGEVLAVGRGKCQEVYIDEEENEKPIYQPLQVKVGDSVLYAAFSGQLIEQDGDELLILKEEQILAVIEPAA